MLYYENENGKLYQGDCLEVMDKLIEEGVKVDCIVTDPPYRTISGGNKKGLSYKHKGSITEKNDGKIFKYNDIKIEYWLPKIYEILKENSHCYIMTNTLNLKNTLIETEKIGFKLHNLLVWEKQNATPNRWYMKNCEYILFLRKGIAKAINNMGSKTVHKFKNPFGDKLHPTEKSIDHMMFLIENSTKEDDIILDPFSGSGTTAVACENTNRKWICIEKEDKYCEISKKRLDNSNQK